MQIFVCTDLRSWSPLVIPCCKPHEASFMMNAIYKSIFDLLLSYVKWICHIVVRKKEKINRKRASCVSRNECMILCILLVVRHITHTNFCFPIFQICSCGVKVHQLQCDSSKSLEGFLRKQLPQILLHNT